MAEPVGDDETFSRGIEQARAALGRPVRSRPRPSPPVAAEPTVEPDEVGPDLEFDAQARIAALEAENRDLRAALAHVLDHARHALDD